MNSPERTNEEKMVAFYMQLTGASEGLARDVCMFLEVKSAREHPEQFEPGHASDETPPDSGIV